MPAGPVRLARMWHRLLCLAGLHRRLGRSVHPCEGGYRATCRHCGRAMERKFDGRWRAARHGDFGT